MNKVFAYSLFAFGMFLIFYTLLMSESYEIQTSTIMAFIGLGLTFWGGLLLYITPSKHVPVELLNASTTSTLATIEKILTESNLTRKGIYLPPKYLKDFESSLAFIPFRAYQSLPIGTYEPKLYSGNPNGIFLIPPGMALLKLFEKKLGTTFTRTDLNFLQNNLQKLLVEDLEIAEKAEIKIDGNIVIVEITNHVFNEVCQETKKLPRIHESIGCILSSGIACALAKVTGIPVIIENEEQSHNGKTMRIHCRMLEG